MSLLNQAQFEVIIKFYQFLTDCISYNQTLNLMEQKKILEV